MKPGNHTYSSRIFLVALSLILAGACNKDDTPPPAPPEQELTIMVGYNVDGAALVSSDIVYSNAAGNPFSVYTLNYFLSGFSLQKMDGSWKELDDIVYLDAFNAEKNIFILKGIPAGDYKAFKLIIGLEPEINESNSLPPTVDNINMSWPDMMGGGYHFLKLEGYFKDANAVTQGYAMHLGTNTFHSEATINQEYVISSGKDTLKLNMNIAEWFKNPNTYDLNIQGNYSMGRDSSMRKLSENGSDVFVFE